MKTNNIKLSATKNMAYLYNIRYIWINGKNLPVYNQVCRSWIPCRWLTMQQFFFTTAALNASAGDMS